uniref:NYN domain-containing protein n=1 Tax=Vitrella brassicaformis TaxID=1169539 RepID=A0A7S1KBB3_9ALVE
MATSARDKAVAIFDGANIWEDYEDKHGCELHVKAFIEFLKHVEDMLGVPISQTYLYESDPDKWLSVVGRNADTERRARRRKAFHNGLAHERICMCTKYGFKENRKQRGVDVGIALRALEVARAAVKGGIKWIILGSGDSDSLRSSTSAASWVATSPLRDTRRAWPVS